MAIERNSIVRTDLPVVRRGYDRDAVDRHLERVADEVAALGDESRAPMATAASAQVKAILEAAEAGAEQIRAEAEADARRIRDEATALRSDASEEARGRIGEASEATSGIVERVDAVEREVDEFATRIRAGVSDVTIQLQRLQDRVGQLRDEQGADEPAGAKPAPAPATVAETPPAEEEDLPPGERETVETPMPARPAKRPATPEPSEPEPDGKPDEDAAADGDDAKAGAKPTAPAAGREQDEAARLVALNLALGGTSRDDARDQLAGQFPGADHDGILEDVYASVGG